MSCSYGPGRYDPAYEEQGQDYPLGFVRWTEQRNFEAVLDLLAAGRLEVGTLVSERCRIDDAARGYEQLASGSPLAIVLEYPVEVQAPVSRIVSLTVGAASARSRDRSRLKALLQAHPASRSSAPATTLPRSSSPRWPRHRPACRPS